MTRKNKVEEVMEESVDLSDLYATDPDQFLQEAATEDTDPELLEELAGEPEVEEPETEEVVKPIKTKRVKNYINNADLLVQLELSRQQDQMTNELVKMFQTLCDRYGAKYNWANYSFLEDMKAYAIYMLVRTWRAFKPEKSQNPFAFFTQCIKHSFIQCLNKEKNERDIRDQLLIEAGLNPSYSYGDGDGDSDGGSDSYD